MAENSGVNCIYHVDHEKTLNRLEGNVTDLYSKYNDLNTKQLVFNERMLMFCESMQDVPIRLAEIHEYSIETKNEVRGLKQDFETVKDKISNVDNERFEKIENKVECMDKESHVNTRTWVRDNFGKLVGIVTFGTLLLTAIATYVISNIIK